MNQLVQQNYYDDLIPLISRISRRTKKVRFELPAEFQFEPEKTAAFASGWSDEIVREERKPNSYGLPIFGPVVKQIIEVTIINNDVFDYLYSRLCQKMYKGNGEGCCTLLTIEP